VCAAGVLGAIAAAVLGPVMLRLRGILFALGMFGLARILGVAFSDFAYAGGGNGMTLPAELTPVSVYAFMAGVALAGFAVNAWFARSGFGLDAMALREDEEAASALGVNAVRVKVIAYVLSAVFPALAGGLVAWNRSYIDPPSMFDPTIDLQSVVFVLFGGIGTVWGPLLGTLVLMAVDEQFLVHFPDMALLLFGLVVIVTVLAFPGGLVSLANRRGWLVRPVVLAPKTLPAGAPPEITPAHENGPVLEVDRGRARRDSQHHRCQRRGQNNAVQHDHRIRRAERGRYPLPWPLRNQAACVPSRADWDGPQLPDSARHGGDDGVGKRGRGGTAWAAKPSRGGARGMGDPDRWICRHVARVRDAALAGAPAFARICPGAGTQPGVGHVGRGHGRHDPRRAGGGTYHNPEAAHLWGLRCCLCRACYRRHFRSLGPHDRARCRPHDRG
jgi:hypothetical protein